MAIEPLELFASLVEHMARWGDALEDSFGLCMLEVQGDQPLGTQPHDGSVANMSPCIIYLHSLKLTVCT